LCGLQQNWLRKATPEMRKKKYFATTWFGFFPNLHCEIPVKETQMAGKQVRITPIANGWKVKTDGASRAAKLTDTKSGAIEAGKQIAKNQGAELTIHGRNGRIQSKDSYGKDPCPPKDTEH